MNCLNMRREGVVGETVGFPTRFPYKHFLKQYKGERLIITIIS